MAKKEIEIALQQILTRDGSVYSVQWVDIPERHRSQVTPSFLLERYYRLIRDFTGSIIRPRSTDECVEFRLFSSPIALLAFAAPDYQKLPEGHAVHLYICGGVLVQSGQCDRGRFSFLIENVSDGVRVTVELSDYCPLLLKSTAPSWFRKNLYRLTQAYIHKIVTVRYLITIYREVTGAKVRPKVKKVRVRHGEEI